jgi:hypothetical protein
MSVTEQDRELAITRSLNTYRETNSIRTLDVQYRGEQISLPVVRVTTAMLLLNHDNNRLSAQLDGHPLQHIVQSEPTSQESQAALRNLLSATKDFKELKAQLKSLGQKEPGLTSRQGLLINGNTRLTALIELEAEGVSSGMDVAILPADVTQQDLLDIEVNLQMTNLVHQDYSFTNVLLMMKRLNANGATNKELAMKLGWIRGGEKKVALRLRVLSMIEEVRTVSDPVLPWSAFDKQEEMFKNIDEKYQALKGAGDIKGAEAVKWSRVTAMFLGLNKDQVRAIDEDFFQEKIIDSRLEANDETKSLKGYLEGFQSQALDDDPGGLFGETEEKNFGDHTQQLFKNLIASSHVRDDKGNVKPDLDGHAALLSRELRRASRAKISKENDESERLRPTLILNEVRLRLDEIALKIPELSADPDFRSQDFKYEVNKLKKVANQIADLRQQFMDN